MAFSNFEPFQEILNLHLTTKNLSKGGMESSFAYKDAKLNLKTRKLIDAQTTLLKDFDISALDSAKKAKAFWINSYNFFMIKVVLEKGFEDDKLKITSVKDLGTFFSPYKIFTQKIHLVATSKYSLDQIEKQILLGKDYKDKGWKDARVHFAVNCASVGCPPLIPKIYDPQTLNETLDANIKRALKTPRHFNIKGKILHLTHLFKWYKNDFIESDGSVKNFLEKYIDSPSQQKALKATNEINYIEYDWKLNKPGNF